MDGFPPMTADDWRRSARNVLAWVMHLRTGLNAKPPHLRGPYYKDVLRQHLLNAADRNRAARALETL